MPISKIDTKPKIHCKQEKRGYYTPVKRQQIKIRANRMRKMHGMQKTKGKQLENKINGGIKNRQKRKLQWTHSTD